MHRPKHNENRSLLHSFVWFIILYVLIPGTALVCAGLLWNVQNQKNALLEESSSYYNEMAAVCEHHISYIGNLITILQDSNAIRDRLNALNLSPAGQAVESQAISDIISVPFTYQNCFNNFAINAVAVYFRDDLVYYTIPNNGVDLALERTKSIYGQNRDATYYDGHFVTASAEQAAYAYYIQDFKNIYNGRYYGKIVIEVAPIPSNLAQAGGSYLPASAYSLDLGAHPSTRYYLYNADQSIIFSSDTASVGQSVSGVMPAGESLGFTDLPQFGDGHTVIYHAPLAKTGLTLYAVTDRKDFTIANNAVSIPFILLVFALYILILVLALRNFYNPLKQVSAYCRAAAQYDRPIPPSFEPSYREIGEISELLMRNAKYTETLEEQGQRAEREHRETQIRALQAQMDPHFLFNMLDVIGWKAERSSSKDIRSMIDHLSEILRYEIKQDQSKISLQQEISYIHQYLSLQQLGGSHEFTYTVNADNDLLDQYYIPKLVLQPLVENAIVHGILQSDRPGDIQIDIWEDRDGIMCRVKDNGVGFDSSAVFGVPEAQPGRHNRIALNNVRKRLNMMYGEPYGLTISSTPGAGTVATIYIPFDPIPANGGADIVQNPDS
ncbi:MAG: sensor histidine kinase [Intestinibacillus sp.]